MIRYVSRCSESWIFVSDWIIIVRFYFKYIKIIII